MRIHSGRLRAIFVCISLAFSGILAGVWHLQISKHHEYSLRAKDRRLLKESTQPLRGKILDRNGIPLARHKPAFDLAVIPGEVKKHIARADSAEGAWSIDPHADWIRRLAQQLAMSSEEMWEIVNKMHREVYVRKWHKTNRPFVILRNIPSGIARKLDVMGASLPGTLIQTRPARFYPYREASAPWVGYMARTQDADNKQLILSEENLRMRLETALMNKSRQRPEFLESYRRWIRGNTSAIPNDVKGFRWWLISTLEHMDYPVDRLVGRAGLEFLREAQLRGLPGRKIIDLHVRLNFSEILSESPALPGEDLRLTVDINLQHVALESLRRKIHKKERRFCKSGAFVMMDVHTGEVLALVSYPTYDPNDLMPPISEKTYRAVYKNPDKPLYNRATRGAYPLGSVFKMLTAIAAMEEAGVRPRDLDHCDGHIRVGSRIKKCWKKYGHQTINMYDAIEQSCNVYFYHAAQKIGPANLYKWAKAFGFADKTGFELNETKGSLPGKLSKGEALNLAIGQGAFTTSPLQVAVYMAALANGGKILQPRLDRTHTARPIIKRRLPIHKQTLDAIRQGMEAVVHGRDGTARNDFHLPNMRVAAKTGTAQAGAGKADHAWFAGFAPAGDPQVCFVVFLEHGEHGREAASVAEAALRYYFNRDREAHE